jgi:type I restriction enzyme S subunit
MSSTWPNKKLGDVCDIKTGKKDVNQGNPNGKYPFFTCAKEHTYSDEYSFDFEALLIAGNGDVGNVSYYNGKFEAYQRTYVLSNFRDVSPQFIFLFLDGFLKDTVSKQKLGNTMPYIKMGMLTDFEIPLPSLPEQQRIVKILDEAFESIAKAKENAGKNLQNVKDLFESNLQMVFDNLNNSQEEREFGEVCELVGGSQPPKSVFVYEPKEGYIRLIQVRDYKTDKFATYIPKKMAKRFCNEKDIMIGRYGPPIFGIFNGLTGAYNVALMKAIPNSKLCSSEYFYWFLRTNKIRTFVETSSKRAVGQDGVRKELLAKYPVPIAPIEEQPKIISKINFLLESTQKLEKIYQQKLSDLDELKKSILNKAFSGNL